MESLFPVKGDRLFLIVILLYSYQQSSEVLLHDTLPWASILDLEISMYQGARRGEVRASWIPMSGGKS
jgi:hypothetical protein